MLVANPAVSIEVSFTNRVVDLINDGFDLAVRVGPLRDSRLVATQLGEISYAVFAGAGYLQARGEPRTPDELNGHDLIAFTPAGRDIVLSKGSLSHTIARSGRLAVNNNWVATDMVARDLGIAVLPMFQAARHPQSANIVPILDGWGRPSVTVSALTASHLYRPPKIDAFIKLARREFAQGLWR